MQAFLRRSVFTLMYKEKCKWCEKDRTDGISGYARLHGSGSQGKANLFWKVSEPVCKADRCLQGPEAKRKQTDVCGI